MLITVTYGKEVFERSHAKFHVFSHKCLTRPIHSDSGNSGSSTKGFCFMWQAAKDDPTGFGVTRVGGQRKSQAAPGLRDEFGNWNSCQFHVVEGGIVRLFGSRKSGNGPPALNACMFLEMNELAPLLKVYGRLTGDHRAAADEVLAFEGKAYQITLEMAAEMQVVLDGNFRASYEDYNQDILFRVHEVAPGIAPRARTITTHVTNSDGDRVRVIRAARRRAIQV